MLRATQLQTKESAAILLCTLASDGLFPSSLLSPLPLLINPLPVPFSPFTERVKQFLGSLNALPSLVSILRVTSDILAQEKIVSVFSQYLTDGTFPPLSPFPPLPNNSLSISYRCIPPCI